MRKYKALNQQVFANPPYSLVPIRHEDRYKIMQWRNEQMYHLRQNEPLTEEQQARYFQEVVAPLFDQKQPDQILFSYLKKESCIGYGGLVHINWQDQHGEISFILNTEEEKKGFEVKWTVFLNLIEQVAFKELKLHKIYTYAYDIRPHIYNIFIGSGYRKEAKLRDHAKLENQFVNVVIHSKIAPYDS